MMEPHEYAPSGNGSPACIVCRGNKDATPHVQWLETQSAEKKKLAGFFDWTADFELGNSMYFSCKRCFAVVYEENLAEHVSWHGK